MRPSSVPIVLACCLPLALAAAGELPPDVEAALEAARRGAPDVPGQALALARLAWGAPGTVEPLVRSTARAELVSFGDTAYDAMATVQHETDPVYQADVVAALIEARRLDRYGNPPDYQRGLEEAIWSASIEGQRLAIIELARYSNFPPTVLTTIDAIHARPELTMVGLRALRSLNDDRSRFFLARVLDLGEPREQRAAARALAMIADTGTAQLRQRLTAPVASVREAAVDALLEISSPNDLTLLRDYVAAHADDDPAVLERVRARTSELEALVEERGLAPAESTAGGEDDPHEP